MPSATSHMAFEKGGKLRLVSVSMCGFPVLVHSVVVKMKDLDKAREIFT